MAISKLHGSYRLINPSLRTMRSSQAILAKRVVRLEPNKRLDPMEIFPTNPNIQRKLPEGVLTIRFNRRILRGSRGSAIPEVMAGILGGTGGLLAGCRLQYHILEETINQAAREMGAAVDFWSFLGDPQVDLKSYGSMMAAGAVGFVMAGGLSIGLARLIGSGEPQQ
ncbi:MAG: hypothetical protein JW782_08140 [Candidatus Saganbacteria bacterium]|nr:hypothetical protein [Candidatus Saganbacteria bacterium]